MTCQDARELFSAEVDAALTAEERAAFAAHLDGCPECRRELGRFRATVAVLRAVEPVRAPVGFVDRVLEAARPAPWPERLRRRLFSPVGPRRLIEVAATVLVALTAVYLYERTPELRQATQVQAPVRSLDDLAQRREPQAPPARGKDSTLAAAPPASTTTGAEGFRKKDTGAPREAERPDAPVPAAGRPAAPPPPVAAPKSRTGAVEEKVSAEPAERARSFRAEPPAAASGPAPAPGTESDRAERAAAPRPPEAARQEAPREVAKRAPAAAFGLAGRLAAPADIEGVLAVTDRATARRALTELVLRLGGTAVARPADARGETLELALPAAAYPELVVALERLGRWQATRQPAELPAQVRVSLVLTE